ncbi:hypothetical protein AC249_AIPGENE7243 [Exaiptasia diaphana]|nr:hypothetical protein AC249_AIPGENE7243 [Exaiptasia diaphana]
MVSLILLVSYAVPSSPANTSKACLFFGGEFVILVTVASFILPCRSDPASKISNYIIMVLRYCNTLANPIIYTGINRQFRGAIKKFVLRKRGNEELNATVYTQPT